MESIVLIIFPLLTLVTCEDIYVQTPSGRIKGLKSVAPYTDDTVYKFYKIPYAKPPIGPLRFRKPEPMEPWADTLDVTDDSARLCMQVRYPLLENYYKNDTTFSEDCLLLDVFVPKILSPDNKYPVMVWIHGGGFLMGGGSDGSDMAVRGDVIVVSIQYRLNIFGFFGVNKEAMKGNYGMWDQKMALTWINKNIASFGGDPKTVTIFGESAGGFSVHFMSLIPSNEGLFQRAIAQSGTSNYLTFHEKTPQLLIDDVIEKSECKLTDDPEAFVECLREIPAQNLTDMFALWFHPHAPLSPYLAYRPTVDGELFPNIPHEMLRDPASDVSRFFHSLDFITGIVSFEGSMLVFVPPEIQEQFGFNISEGISLHYFCEGIAIAYADAFYGGDKDVSKAICDYYTLPSGATSEEQSMRIIAYAGDSFFKVHAINALDSHSLNDKRKTFFYQISRPSATPFGGPMPKWFKGCGHGDDVLVMFKHDFNKEDVKKKDMEYSNMIISYWTNFAKTGDPNGFGTPTRWPEYSQSTKQYLDIDTVPSVKENMSPEDVRFWNENIPAVIKRSKDEL